MSGTQCIGRMGGREGDWRAELDWNADMEFVEPHATIIERGPKGESILIAEAVPIVKLEPENPDRGPELDPSSATNKALMKIVFAPEAWATLASIKADLERRYPNDMVQPGEMPAWVDSIVDQIDRTLECLSVPSDESEPDEMPDGKGQGCGSETYP